MHLKDSIWDICISNIPTWNKVPAEAITSGRLLGMSNTVMSISINSSDPQLQDIEPNRVVLRIYPPKSNRTVNREKEQAIFDYFSKMGIGVRKLYGCPEYRIEEFFDGEKLYVKELHDITLMKKIAKAFCNYNYDQRLFKIISQFESVVPFAHRVIDEWQPLIKEEFESYESSVKTEKGKDMLKKLKFITTPEFEKEYRQILKGLGKSALVASHCDVHEMNILRSNDKKRVILIDYEYATFNYRAIDIATLLIETTIDYTYPSFPYFSYSEDARWTDEELTFFLKCYLEREAVIKGEQNIEKYVELEMPVILSEVVKAEALVSAWWIMWSLVLVDWSAFDEIKDWNLEYALLRLDMYEKAKQDAMESD